jgi:hypothetical protein
MATPEMMALIQRSFLARRNIISYDPQATSVL